MNGKYKVIGMNKEGYNIKEAKIGDKIVYTSEKPYMIEYTIDALNTTDTLTSGIINGADSSGNNYYYYIPKIYNSSSYNGTGHGFEKIEIEKNDGTILKGSVSSYSSTKVCEIKKIRLYYYEDTYCVRFLGYLNQTDKIPRVKEISYFNISNFKTYDKMFYLCKFLEKVKFEGYSNYVKNTSYMFYYCSSLTSLDLSNFNTSNVTNISYMFYYCSSLTSLDLSNFNTSNVTNIGNIFKGCESLTSLNLSNWDNSKLISMYEMFNGCSSLTSLDLSNFGTSNVTNMGYIFKGCLSLTSLNLSSFDTSKVTNMSGMFNDCESLTSLDLSNFNTSNVTDMRYMFAGCDKLTSLNVSSFDTSKVNIMFSMFGPCESLTSLDLSNFDTSNVTIMGYMFQFCESLTSLDLSNFNTSNVTNMEGMFVNCNKLTSLNLSNFNTSNVTNMDNMLTQLPSNVNWYYDGNNYKNFTLTESQTGYSGTFPWTISDESEPEFLCKRCGTIFIYNGEDSCPACGVKFFSGNGGRNLLCSRCGYTFNRYEEQCPVCRAHLSNGGNSGNH